jgi:hypothetical protein
MYRESIIRQTEDEDGSMYVYFSRGRSWSREWTTKLSRALYPSRLRHELLLVCSFAEFADSERYIEGLHGCDE